MIYTCYEMVRDCRAGVPAGWVYFISNYVPVLRKTVAHYAPERAGDTVLFERILMAIRKPESFLFTSDVPPEERWFVAQLRQLIVGELEMAAPEIPIGLETLTAALGPLTMTERQAAWFETMGYAPEQTGPMLRISPATVEKVRGRAAELIRGQVDSWRRTLLAENGPALGREAAVAAVADCLPTKAFLDAVDGRTTWRGREAMERHLRECWHCIDHFCRMLEVVQLLRDLRPVSETEAAQFQSMLGVEPPRPSGWKRLIGRA